MDELREHPQVAELIDTLDKNDMHKEKAEVESLVSFIGEMEKTMAGMLEEMKEMRREINLIHNNSLKVRCRDLVEKAEGKVRQGLALISKVKDNVIQSAKNALKAFREKGKEAFRSAVKAMKIPETFDKLASFFGKLSKSFEQDALRVEEMKSELSGAKRHLKNVGTLLIFRTKRETDEISQDKGSASRIGILLGRIGKNFGNLSQKAMDKADKIRVTKVRESVKETLDSLKAVPGERTKNGPPLER